MFVIISPYPLFIVHYPLANRHYMPDRSASTLPLYCMHSGRWRTSILLQRGSAAELCGRLGASSPDQL